MQFTDEEIETIKALINDHGSDYYLSADFEKVNELGVKLGVRDPILPPTEKELAEQETFRNSPTGQMMTSLFKKSNEYYQKIAEDIQKDNVFMNGKEWTKDQVLRIRIPNDKIIKD